MDGDENVTITNFDQSGYDDSGGVDGDKVGAVVVVVMTLATDIFIHALSLRLSPPYTIRRPVQTFLCLTEHHTISDSPSDLLMQPTIGNLFAS